VEKKSMEDMMAEDGEGTTDKAMLKKVSVLARQVELQAKRIKAGEEKLAELKKNHAKLLRDDIPDAMREAGLDAFETKELKVVLVQQTHAAISKANMAEAMAWLRGNGYSSIIKSLVNIDVNAEDEKSIEYLEGRCAKMGLPFTHKMGVHAGTLKAFIRSLREQKAESKTPQDEELNPPEKLFGIYEFTEAKVTNK
jgi:hypothetical protein